MRYVVIIGMSLSLFGHAFCLAILPLASAESGWQPWYEYVEGNGITSFVELAVIALAVKAAPLLKRANLIRV
jgi:hypothetical protein